MTLQGLFLTLQFLECMERAGEGEDEGQLTINNNKMAYSRPFARSPSYEYFTGIGPNALQLTGLRFYYLHGLASFIMAPRRGATDRCKAHNLFWWARVKG